MAVKEVKEVKDMGASVLARLKRQSKDTGLNFQTCLQLFAQEEFLRRLEASRYAENLILKGGMFLYTLTNYEGRPTMDTVIENIKLSFVTYPLNIRVVKTMHFTM